MRVVHIRTLGSSLALALALAIPVTAHCDSADPAAIAVSSSPAAPSIPLLIAAALAFPAAMFAGAFLIRTKHSLPSGLD